MTFENTIKQLLCPLNTQRLFIVQAFNTWLETSGIFTQILKWKGPNFHPTPSCMFLPLQLVLFPSLIALLELLLFPETQFTKSQHLGFDTAYNSGKILTCTTREVIKKSILFWEKNKESHIRRYNCISEVSCISYVFIYLGIPVPL